VSPTTFGLTSTEILTASDAQLNDFVGLKKLAPYRARTLKDGDERRYGKKKRLREWRKKVKEEGEDEEIRAMLRPENVEQGKSDLAGTVESNQRKKTRKARKGETKDQDRANNVI
jgi:protein KRI1